MPESDARSVVGGIKVEVGGRGPARDFVQFRLHMQLTGRKYTCLSTFLVAPFTTGPLCCSLTTGPLYYSFTTGQTLLPLDCSIVLLPLNSIFAV